MNTISRETIERARKSPLKEDDTYDIKLSDQDMFDPQGINIKGMAQKAKADADREKAEREETEKRNKLKANAEGILQKIKSAPANEKFDVAFSLLVSRSGKSDTLAGELLRAVNWIIGRAYNDGDRFFEGYGLDTVASAAQFLYDNGFQDEIQDILDEAHYYAQNYSAYIKVVDELGDLVLEYIINRPETLSTPNTVDMIYVKPTYIEENQPTYRYSVPVSDTVLTLLDDGKIDSDDVISFLEYEITYNGDSSLDGAEVDSYYSGDAHIDVDNLAIYGYNTLKSWFSTDDRVESFWEELAEEHMDESLKEYVYSDENIKKDTKTMKLLVADAEALDNSADSEFKGLTKKVYEALRYTTPLSKPNLKEYESKLQNLFADFEGAVNAKDIEKATSLSKQIVAVANKRESVAKLHLGENKTMTKKRIANRPVKESIKNAGKFKADDQGTAPITYVDAVRKSEKREGDIEKSMKPKKKEVDDLVKANGRDAHKATPKTQALKKMHLSESLFESVDDTNPLANIRSNVIEFPNGEYVHIEYKDGKIVAGGATNTGIIPQYEIEYDHDISVDDNIQNLYDLITEKDPDKLEECKKSTKRARKLKEQITDDMYEVAAIMDDAFDNMGTDKIYRDDFDEQFALACREVYGVDNIWDETSHDLDTHDIETSVRGILSYSGWDTIYEGDDEGGLERVTESRKAPKGKKSLKEDVNVDEVADFIETSVDTLLAGEATNCRYILDSQLALYVGWTAGWGREKRDDIIQDPNDLDWAIDAGIKMRNEADWADFEYLNFPYYENGEILDLAISVEPNEDYVKLAKILLDMYNGIKDYEIDDDGLIINDGGNDNMNEATAMKTPTKGVTYKTPKYDDLWEEIYGNLTEDGGYVYKYVDGKRTPIRNFGLGYTNDQVGEDRLNGRKGFYNIKVTVDSERELQPAKQLAAMYKPYGVETVARSNRDGFSLVIYIPEGARAAQLDTFDIIGVNGKKRFEEDYIYNENETVNEMAENIADYLSEFLNATANTEDISEYLNEDELKEIGDMMDNFYWLAKHYGKITESNQSKKRQINEATVMYDLSNYKPWSGAVDTWYRINDEGYYDAFERLIDELYPDGIGETELNDLLWFEEDWVYEMLGMTSENDEDEDEEDIDEGIVGGLLGGVSDTLNKVGGAVGGLTGGLL